MRSTLTALAAGFALLVLPQAGHAAVTFGSRLNHDPANSGECMQVLMPCTIASFVHPTDPNGDPYSGGAPVDGVITKFRIRAFGGGDAPASVTFRLVDVTLPDPMDNGNALGSAAGTGPTVTIPAGDDEETPVREFPAALPVKKGDHLAIDGTNVNATYNSGGDKFSYVFAPTLTDGEGPRGSTAATGELLVQAVIEPAPGGGSGPNGGCGSTCDTTAPRAGGLRVSAGKILYSLSEDSTASMAIARSSTGRKVHGRCVAVTRANRRHAHCTRLVAVGGGAFPAPGNAGANSLILPRPHGRALGAGLYRVTLTVSDAAGNKSTSTRKFRITRR